MGGRLILEVDLYTSKYGTCTVHKSSSVARNIVPYLKKYGKNPVTGEVWFTFCILVLLILCFVKYCIYVNPKEY